jgi:penicillin G amidase
MIGRRNGVWTAVALAWLSPAAVVAMSPEAVTIMRDAYGVPHIFTSGPGAAERGAYGNGYAQAQDRLFEMDILRRAATGRLAEMLGADFVAMDRVVRRDGFTAEEREEAVRRLSPRNRRALEAYRDGVNAFIAKVTADPMLLPFEFLETPPAPWEVTDTVAVAQLEFMIFGASGGAEVLNADFLLDLLDRFSEPEARGIFDDFHWLDDPAAPTTIAASDADVADPDRVERFAPAQLDLVRAVAPAIRRAAVALRAEQGILGGLGHRLGLPVGVHRHASNAILVGPTLSASGHPILLGGPQTALNAPSFFWEIGLHGGGYDAEGVIAPSGPGVIIGRGRGFAMTITSGILDNVDTFVEFLDPADPGRYVFRGRSRPFERRTETIAVGGGTPETIEVLRTVHGPVAFLDAASGVAFSRRGAFRGRELDSAAAIVRMGYVHNLREFRRLADRVWVSLNLHYADVAGNIAYFHRGGRPVRARDTDPRLPFDGRGGMEWRGRLLPKRMPAVVNPARGYITNWNNKPLPGWSAGEQRELWGVVDRVQVFADALEAARTAGTKLTPADVNALMRRAATSDIFAARILPFLEDAVAALDQTPTAPLPTATALLRAWVDAGAPLVAVPDRTGVIPFPGAAIYREFRSAVQHVFADELGSAWNGMFYPPSNEANQEDDHGSLFSPDAVFLRALFAAGPVAGTVPPPDLLPLSRNYFDDVASGTPGTRNAALVAALSAALDSLTTRFGTTDQSAWLLPALMESYMDLGAISTIFGPTVQERQNRGTFNLLVELGQPPHGQIILPPGESGSFTFSDVRSEPPHLRDQLGLFEAFGYRTQPFLPADLEPPVTSETIPILR